VLAILQYCKTAILLAGLNSANAGALHSFAAKSHTINSQSVKQGAIHTLKPMGFKHTELSSQNGYCKTTCTHVAYL
jgi:hypothetical protein